MRYDRSTFLRNLSPELCRLTKTFPAWESAIGLGASSITLIDVFLKSSWLILPAMVVIAAYLVYQRRSHCHASSSVALSAQKKRPRKN